MRTRVKELIERADGKYARMIIEGGSLKPGQMRMFDIPAEDFQIGDKIEFAPIRIDRKMAVTESYTHQVRYQNEVDITPVMHGLAEVLTLSPGDFVKGAMGEDAIPQADGDGTDFGHETIHPHSEGA